MTEPLIPRAERARLNEAMSSLLPSPSSAFTEGADTALLHQAPINPYRRAMRALTDPGSLETLGKLAVEWENGYVSAKQ